MDTAFLYVRFYHVTIALLTLLIQNHYCSLNKLLVTNKRL